MLKAILKMLGLDALSAKKRSIDVDTEKKIVSSLSRGNISLQSGHYITADDIDRMREQAFN